MNSYISRPHKGTGPIEDSEDGGETTETNRLELRAGGPESEMDGGSDSGGRPSLNDIENTFAHAAPVEEVYR